MGVKVSGSARFTGTAENDLFSVPGAYVAYLRRLSVTNESTALATVTVRFYNGTAGKVVLTLSVAAGETVVLAEGELPIEGCPTRITVASTQAPYSVDYSVELE
jgi:hypothetical protein